MNCPYCFPPDRFLPGLGLVPRKGRPDVVLAPSWIGADEVIEPRGYVPEPRGRFVAAASEPRDVA